MTHQKMTDIPMPFVSVIIPVYNDSERLKICLEALDNQTYPKELYELIVVDNGSDDNLEGLVLKFEQAYLAYESRPGSYAARNKGIFLSKGQVIAFTDSDCIPASDWIEKGVLNILRIPNCGLMAGKINLFFKNQSRLTAVEIYEKINAFPQQTNVEQRRYGVTANLFTLTSVIHNVGYFNEALKSGGDFEWGNRVFSAGYKLIYTDDACVAHPARHSLEQLYKKSVRTAGGIYNSNQKDTYSIIECAIDLAGLMKMILGLLYRYIFNLTPSDQLHRTKDKINYVLVIAFIKIVKIFERIRIQSGATPQR